MRSSVVKYVRGARLVGRLFDEEVEGEDGRGTVRLGNTQFYVDHKEPMRALERVRENGKEWEFGELREGCEFLFIGKAEAKATGSDGDGV